MTPGHASNRDDATVAGFGDEWTRFDQSALSDEERSQLFARYFDIFPWPALPEAAQGFDLGCGSGRWAKCVAPRVGKLHCIDAAEAALEVARRTLRTEANCVFHCASVDSIPLPDASMDFGYSLGVLHHTPNTADGIAACVRKLKPGAPFLLYLYYAFDNRPAWYRGVWQLSDGLRQIVSRLPYGLRYLVSQAIAAGVYAPLAGAAKVVEAAGLDPSLMPLASYRNQSFYTMRTDALDRFGTRLEQRFTRGQIQEMMERAGLERITFSNEIPYWCAVGYRTLLG